MIARCNGSDRGQAYKNSTQLAKTSLLSRRILRVKSMQKIFEANFYDLAMQTPFENGFMVVIPSGKRGGNRGSVASVCNHAEGFAMAPTRLGVRPRVVMGENTPSIKINSVRANSKFLTSS